MVNAQNWLNENYPKHGIYQGGITNHYNFGKRREEVTKIDIWAWNGLEGSLNLEGFTNLEDFNCWANSLSELDVSGAPNLKKVNCSSNYLRKLTLGNLVNLIDLDCNNNQLSELDISNCPNLKKLNFDNNHLNIDQIKQSREEKTINLFVINNYYSQIVINNEVVEEQVAQIEFPSHNQC